MLAIVEAVTGMFYVTLLIARLVSLYSSNRARNDSGAERRRDSEPGAEAWWNPGYRSKKRVALKERRTGPGLKRLR